MLYRQCEGAFLCPSNDVLNIANTCCTRRCFREYGCIVFGFWSASRRPWTKRPPGILRFSQEHPANNINVIRVIADIEFNTRREDLLCGNEAVDSRWIQMEKRPDSWKKMRILEYTFNWRKRGNQLTRLLWCQRWTYSKWSLLNCTNLSERKCQCQ